MQLYDPPSRALASPGRPASVLCPHRLPERLAAWLPTCRLTGLSSHASQNASVPLRYCDSSVLLRLDVPKVREAPACR